MKRFTKILILVLALCQICGCFFACTDKETADTQENGEPAFTLTKEQLAQYTIVTPASISNINSVALKLQSVIESYTGVKLPIKIDTVVAGSDATAEGEYELIVGYADRAAVSEVYKTAKSKDYGYSLVGKKLVFLGCDADTAERSVMQFKLNVIDKIGAEPTTVVLETGAEVIMAGTYTNDSFLLNGVNIGEYAIVYPYGCVKGESEMATALADYVKSTTGFVLQCVDDRAETYEYSIQIGDTKHVTDAMRADRDAAGYNGQKSYIGKTGNTVWLSGSSRSTLYMSLSKLLKSVTVTDKTMSVTVDESKCLTFGSLKVSVMSFNVFYDLSSKLRNPDDVIVTVKNKNPDVFGLNEAGADWIAKFKKDAEISAKYDCAEGKPAENASDASYNPIFFDKAKLELVESGTKWLSKTPDRMSKDSDAKHYKILTYAILKDKASGTEFIYINAHLDGSNEADAQVALANVRKRQAEIVKSFAANYLFMPVIIGGDFNEQPSSGVIATITNGTRFKYCMTVADKKIDIGTTKKVTSNFTPCGNSILDYIFVTTDCINVDLYEQYDNKIDGKYSSDHLPVYTELTILY